MIAEVASGSLRSSGGNLVSSCLSSKPTSYTYAGEPFTWSPDSKIIAYISASETIQADELMQRRSRVIDRMQKIARLASDRLRTHVYFTFGNSPEPRQLTNGPYYDHALSFSPRGDEVRPLKS